MHRRYLLRTDAAAARPRERISVRQVADVVAICSRVAYCLQLRARRLRCERASSTMEYVSQTASKAGVRRDGTRVRREIATIDKVSLFRTLRRHFAPTVDRLICAMPQQTTLVARLRLSGW